MDDVGRWEAPVFIDNTQGKSYVECASVPEGGG